MEILKATILERKKHDILLPEVVLATTNVKNLRPTQALERSINFTIMQDQSIPRFNIFCLLDSTIYLFLYEKELTLNLAKWDVNTLKEKRIGLDGYTIYKIHI